MKKILTLMAAIAAASSAMAHDYNWTPTVGADGSIENCPGLTYGTVTGDALYGKKFSFNADANDKITLSVSGDNLGVTVNGVQLEVVITEGKMTFTASNGGLVEILLGENTVVSNITVVSEKKTNIENAIKKANDILDARVNNISKYVNNTSDFYTAVRTLINVEGGKLTKLAELLKEFADKDLMGQSISADMEPGYETSATIDRTDGETYIASLLAEIEAAIGTEVNATTDTEKGSILTEAETAYGKYDAIINKSRTEVSAAETEITKQTTAGSGSNFYENAGTVLRPNYVEKWTADNTASKTRALDLFKSYVEQYRDALTNSALEALNKFADQTELDALPSKFNDVKTRSTNLSDRYTFEETVGGLKTGAKNYDAIKTLSTEVSQLTDLASKGYKNADGTVLFDGEAAGLTDLKEKSENLYKKVSDTTNKHLIANPASVFTGEYNTINNSINGVKTAWGTTAQSVLTAKLKDVQDVLTDRENTITTKYQNNAQKLQEYQQEFAKLQVRLNTVKAAVADVSTPDKAYDVAIKYNTHDIELDAVRTAIGDLWTKTQTAENQAIIEANNKAYENLESVAKELDTFANSAVARLTKFREDKFFTDYYGGSYEAFKTSINERIKTIYDYAEAIRKAKEEAFAKKEACNQSAEGEVKSALADITEYMTVITNDKTSIETALNQALDGVNDDVYAYFMTNPSSGTNYYNGYVAYVTASINGTNFNGGYDYSSYRQKGSVLAEIEYKANNTVAVKDNAADAACKDAIALVDKAVNGTLDANGTLVEADNDIANAIKKINALKAAKTLADDVVGENTVKTILTAAKTAADNAKSMFDAYADEKTELYNLMVKWSENQANIATATGDAAQAVKDALATLRGDISAADNTLTTVDKLNFDAAKYAKDVKDFKAKLSYTTDAKTFALYTDVKEAKEAAEKQIADAKTALAELTKANAKADLQAAINVAENTVTKANSSLETALADYTFAGKANNLLKDYQSVDLKKAIEDAQKADKVVPGDLYPDGVIDEKDYEKAQKDNENELMSDAEFNIFLKYYKASINNNK